jgi:hypothetical protein
VGVSSLVMYPFSNGIVGESANPVIDAIRRIAKVHQRTKWATVQPLSRPASDVPSTDESFLDESSRTRPGLVREGASGQVIGSKVATVHAGVTESYIGLVFGCAFLAHPDSVEAILAGRQPRDLTLKKVCGSIPLSWAEKRQQFGDDLEYC